MAQGLDSWKIALNDVKCGRGNRNVVILSGSLGAGCAGTGNQMANNARSASLGKLLDDGWVSSPSSAANFMGDNQAAGAGVTLAQYDSRITLGTGWASSNGDGVTTFAANWMRRDAGTATDALQFTPGVSYDRIALFGSNINGSGSVNIVVSGGTIGTLALSGPDNTRSSLVVSKASGTESVSLTTTATFVYPLGLMVWDSSVSQVQFINGSWWGGTTTDMTQTGRADTPLGWLDQFEPALVIIFMCANDAEQGISVATMQANLRTIISRALARNASVLMVKEYYFISTFLPAATWDTYRAAIDVVVAETGIAVMDTTQINANWASYALANAAGYMDADGIHATGTGYSSIAAAVGAQIDFPGPGISQQPQGQTVPDGSSVNLSITGVSTGGSLTYQWRLNGSNIGGATSSTYSTGTLSTADDGAIYDCLITDSNGTITSDPAVIEVYAPLNGGEGRYLTSVANKR